MLKCKTSICVFVLFVILFQGIVLAQAPTEDFINNPITPQTYVFVAQFTAQATADSVDGVLGLSKEEPASYDDYSCKILFNNAGFITANNGKSFEAVSDLAYTAGTTYTIKQSVNILAQTFSVLITPEGGNEVTIAEDFAFSPTAGVVNAINYRSVKMSFDAKWGGAEGMVVVTNFTATNAVEDWFNTPIESQGGKFVARFNAKPTVDKIDGVLGFANRKADHWDSLSIKFQFSNLGFFKSVNSNSYEAVSDLAYSGGETYAVKILVDIPAKVYSAWVTPEGGNEVLIADNFVFSPNPSSDDSLNYFSSVVSFDPQWGGAEGNVEITNFTISDAPSDKWSCMFIRTGYPERQAWDDSLIANFRQKYDLTLVTDNDIQDGKVTVDDLKEHDFCFVSESKSGWKLADVAASFIKPVPIPFFHAGLWFTQPQFMGMVSADGFFGTISDSTGNGGKVIIIDSENHPLSAGFADGAEIEIATETDEDDELGMLTYCVPEVDYIPIAVSSVDPNWTVVFGVEEGTPLWDDLGLAIDPNFVTENRVASVGLYSRSSNYITEDGYKLIHAGIKWIMKDTTGTAVEHEVIQPVDYTLAQNFPNPFNPATEILFSLKKAGHTTLIIYNIVGQKVETLIDNAMPVGKHYITFRAENIPSGVYFYQLRSGDYTEVKKMMLMK
jgi:hypothetical protein